MKPQRRRRGRSRCAGGLGAAASRCCPPGCCPSSASFGRGDPVEIKGPGGAKLGTGLSRYTAVEAGAIRGQRTSEIEPTLGYPGRAALIHRDDMALDSRAAQEETAPPVLRARPRRPQQMKDATTFPLVMADIGARAKAAAAELAFASAERKHAALIGAADAVWKRRAEIIEANRKDLEFGRDKGLSDALMDRLMLDEDRIRGIVDSLRAVAEQPDPVGAGDRRMGYGQRAAHSAACARRWA